MRAYFDTFPLPTSPYAAGAVTGFYRGAGLSIETSNHGSVRTDYMISSADMRSVRYTYDTPFQFTPRVSPQNSRTFDVKPGDFRHYVESSNKTFTEDVVNAIPDVEAWAWMQANVPLFACPDPDVERMPFQRSNVGSFVLCS